MDVGAFVKGLSRVSSFLDGLQSNSGLWIVDVRLSVNIWLTKVNLCVYVWNLLCNPAIPSSAVSCSLTVDLVDNSFIRRHWNCHAISLSLQWFVV